MRISARRGVQLRRADASRLLEFVADAQAVEDPYPFTRDLLARLVAVTESDAATYIEVEYVGGRRVVRSHLTYSTRFIPQPPNEGWVGQTSGRTSPALTKAKASSRGPTTSIGHPGCGASRCRGRSLRARRLPSHTSVARLPPPTQPRARLHRTHPANRERAPAARRYARAPRTRPPPPRGAQAAVGLAEEATHVASSSSEAATSSSTRRPAQRLLAAWFGTSFGGRLPSPSATGSSRRRATNHCDREQRHAARRRRRDARWADRRRGASATAADGEGGRGPARPCGWQVDRRDRTRAVRHPRDREQAPRARLPQARRASRTAALAAIGARVDTLRGYPEATSASARAAVNLAS